MTDFKDASHWEKNLITARIDIELIEELGSNFRREYDAICDKAKELNDLLVAFDRQHPQASISLATVLPVYGIVISIERRG